MKICIFLVLLHAIRTEEASTSRKRRETQHGLNCEELGGVCQPSNLPCGGSYKPIYDCTKCSQCAVPACCVPNDCHCRILGDPIVETCSGDTLFFGESDGPLLAVVSNIENCQFNLYAQAFKNSLKLFLSTGNDTLEIHSNGVIIPAQGNIPNATLDHFTDGIFFGLSILYSCGVQIRFGREGKKKAFVKADIKLPDGRLPDIIGGFCTTNNLGVGEN